MKKNLFLSVILSTISLMASAKVYYVSPDGDDAQVGTKDAPFATLACAQRLVQAGDTVYLRGGVYRVAEHEVMKDDGRYVHVFDMDKSGTGDARICYWGYPGERPVFDLSAVRPEGRRVSVFYVTGSHLHFKNFEIVGTQVTVKGHTQSECISARGGSNNTFEYLSMHDGMAIGYYQTAGSNNLVLNCDAYNNYDNYSEGVKGGNVDGFGAHLRDEGDAGNVFRGCRAWWNSDDGFDLINCKAPVVIEDCWSFYNGYQPGTLRSAGDGTGFKAGGYGMNKRVREPRPVPMHVVRRSLAYYNKNKGFYANHHLGGIRWEDNVGYRNPSNYCMLNRKSAREQVDVDGYGHVIVRNMSLEPRREGWHIVDVDVDKCEMRENLFDGSLRVADFLSVDETELLMPRSSDGALPETRFLKRR